MQKTNDGRKAKCIRRPATGVFWMLKANTNVLQIGKAEDLGIRSIATQASNPVYSGYCCVSSVELTNLALILWVIETQN
jgi:hypothetical protein